MKKVTLLILLFTGTQWAKAQPPHDTIWGGFPNQPYLNQVLRATVVSGETEQIIIHPNREPFCFDKKITVKGTTGSRIFEQCLYLDTKGGLVGYLPPATSRGGGLCDIKPDDKRFIFGIIGLKGNVYTYKNTEKNGEIKHWVSSGNSQTYLYQTPNNTGVYTLHNKGERRDYCDGAIKATSYKYDGAASPTMFLFGKTYPQDIHVTAKKYLGNLGIGYQYTDKGLYIIMEMLGGGYTCKITSIEEVNVCFDPSPFQLMEDRMQAQQTEALDKIQQKIAREEQQASNSRECQAEKMAVVNFKKEQLQKQRENLANSQQGNVYQDANTQKAYANMMDPLVGIQEGILDTKVSICAIQQRMQRNNGDNSSNQEKLNCKTALLSRLINTEAQMKALDNRYANNPGQAFAEKSKLALAAYTGSGCN